MYSLLDSTILVSCSELTRNGFPSLIQTGLMERVNRKILNRFCFRFDKQNTLLLNKHTSSAATKRSQLSPKKANMLQNHQSKC